MNKLIELLANKSDYSTFMDMVMDPPMFLIIVAFGYFSITGEGLWLNGILVLGSLGAKLYDYKGKRLIKNISRVIRGYGLWTIVVSASVFSMTLSIFFVAPGIGKIMIEDANLKAICYFLAVLPILKIVVLALIYKKAETSKEESAN